MSVRFFVQIQDFKIGRKFQKEITLSEEDIANKVLPHAAFVDMQQVADDVVLEWWKVRP